MNLLQKHAFFELCQQYVLSDSCGQHRGALYDARRLTESARCDENFTYDDAIDITNAVQKVANFCLKRNRSSSLR